MKNAFCIDLEDWFHVCDAENEFSEPETWERAESEVVHDTNKLLDLLDSFNCKATFFTLGWIAEKYPDLIKNISSKGHEIGCHGYWHKLLFDQTVEEFKSDLIRSLNLLRDLSGQKVSVYRAPGFSMKKKTFWAYEILAKNGIKVDASIVPANRDHGGINGFIKDPFKLIINDDYSIICFPVSVMRIFGKQVPFSGGGYLRLLPNNLIRNGFTENHNSGRPCMVYIHPREINPNQPRLALSPIKYFKYYVNINNTFKKLIWLLKNYNFTTVSNIILEKNTMESHPISTLAS